MTIFVFSDDLPWLRENLHLDMPVYFVEGCERISEEIFLMSQCRHNIISNSSFSWWGAWLNQHPDKKVCAPKHWFRRWYHDRCERVCESWIKIDNDVEKIPNVDLIPGISLVIYLDGGIDEVRDTMKFLPSQRIPYLEFIIINNSSDADVGSFCRKFALGRRDVRLVSLRKKIGRGAAWNLGIGMARGEFIMFLKDGDCVDLEQLYAVAFHRTFYADMIHSVGSKSQTASTVDEQFKDVKDQIAVDWSKNRRVEHFVLNRINSLLGTNIFNRNFLIENRIHFDEDVDDKVELFFLIECLLKINKLIVTPTIFYIDRNAKALTSEPTNERPKSREEFAAELDAVQHVFDLIDDVQMSRQVEKFFIERLWLGAIE